MKNHQNSVKYSRMVALIPNVGSKHNLGGRIQRKRKQKSGGYGGAGGYPQSWGAKKNFFLDNFFRKSIQIVCTSSFCPTAPSEKMWGQKEVRGGDPPWPPVKKWRFLHFFRISSAKRPPIASGRSNIFCRPRNSASNRWEPVIVAQKRTEIRGFESWRNRSNLQGSR